MISTGKRFIIFGVALIISSASPEQVDLLDTRRATTDLNWFTSPNGWNELSSQDETRETYRTFQVCNKLYQRNWLATNTIKLDRLRNVYVEIKFTIRQCQDSPQKLSCKETFNLFYSTTNSSTNYEDNGPLRENLYKKIDTIAADQRHGLNASVVTRRIGYLSSNEIRFGFLDTGACMMIYYIRVYYNRCASAVRNLAWFPATSTGPSTVSLVRRQGTCVGSSVWNGDRDGPTLYCNAKGEWQLPGMGCQCQAGYQPNKDGTRCVECGKYQYKAVMGNAKCTKCPSYSSTSIKGSAECKCNSGYFRAAKDSSSAPCKRPPSKPGNVEYRVEDTSVHISWSNPAYTGPVNDVFFNVSCDRCDPTYSRCTECWHTVRKDPGGSKLWQPRISIFNLRAHMNYRFRIYSFNDVSALSGQKPAFVEVKIKTGESTPSAAKAVRLLSSTDSKVVLAWQAPVDFKGKVKKYEVHISSEWNKFAAISRSYTTTAQSLLVDGLPSDETFIVKVRAQNEAGFGPFSVPVSVATLPSKSTEFRPRKVGDFYRVGATSPKNNSATEADYSLTAVIITVACVVIIAVLIGFYVIRGKQDREKFGCEDVEIYPFFDDPAELLHQQKEHRFYVDPSSYSDLNEAIVEFAREIDCYKIKREAPIATGEFSDLCKGFLRPSSFICDDTMATSMSMKPTNLSVAVKVLKDGAHEKEKTKFLEEATVMGQFHHPNVVRLEGVVSRSTPAMIVTEWMENGSLVDFLQGHRAKGATIDTLQLLHMLHDIAEGMRYLSRMGFVHKNLSTKNVLISDQFVCKISEFCIDKPLESVEEGDRASAICKCNAIPIRCAAPEVISLHSFTNASDVWSFGILTWEVLSVGEHAYWGMSNHDIVSFLECGYRLPPPPFCPRVLHNILLNCWNNKPTRRPTFCQILTQLDSVVSTPDKLHDTINNIPLVEQPVCVPELLDVPSLGRWLEDMNMDHYRDILLRNGCVTADQIINLSINQLDEMEISDPSMQRILLDGAEYLRQKLEVISSIGIGITV